MAKMSVPQGAVKEESAEERMKWKAFRQYVREVKPRKDTTFEVPGYIKTLTGDPDNPGQPKYQEGEGDRKARYVLDAICVVTDARFYGLEYKKTIGFSFFDGKLRGGGNSPFKGGLYNVHLAVTGEEPSPALVSGKGEFDPEEDYTGEDHPLMLRLIYRGVVEEGDKYYGRRGNLTVFLDGFEPLADKVESDFDDDGDEQEDTDGTFFSEAKTEKEPWEEE